jgi:hypothetical protein
MTLLTHAPSPAFGRGSSPKARPDNRPAETLTEQPKVNRIAQVCRFVFAVTMVTAALAGIIALKASIYLARFSL